MEMKSVDCDSEWCEEKKREENHFIFLACRCKLIMFANETLIR